MSDFLKKNFFIFALLSFLVFISYLNSLSNSFISDDIAGIPNNPNIKNVSYIFSNPTGFSRSIIYFTAFQIDGPNPTVFRTFNILFHLGNAWLIYFLIFLLSKRKDIAFLTSALFAVHPILTESVTWISGGAYSEYTFFMLLSFILYLRSKISLRLYILSLAFFFLAITTSEKAIVLPFILILYELSLGNVKKNWKKTIPYIILTVALGMLFLGLRLGTRLEYLSSSFGQAGGFRNPLIQIPVAISSYLKVIFFPDRLSFFYPAFHFTIIEYFIRLSVFLVFLSVIVLAWKKNKLLFFWLGYFIVTLLPTFIPLQIVPSVQERYVYNGAVGILFAIAYALSELWNKKKYRFVAGFLIGLIVVALIVRTNFRNIDWKNSENFWMATVKTSPRNPVARLNVANVYYLQGNLKSAENELKVAISVNPYFVNAYHALGIVYRRIKRDDLALSMFQKSVELNPNLWQGHNNLGLIYVDQKNYAKAVEEFSAVLRLKPDDKVAREWINKITNSKIINNQQ